MKFLLTAVNAKYIHSNPAIYSLRAFAGEELKEHIELAEYTINMSCKDILADIYYRKPDVIGISCYIWNRIMVEQILAELPKILPGVDIWLGGPEVSYDAERILRKLPQVTGIMIGEGEATFKEVLEYYVKGSAAFSDVECCGQDGIMQRANVPECKGETDSMNGQSIQAHSLQEIPGLYLRSGYTPMRGLTNMDDIPFLYNDLKPFENKIIYYETSRGCPYRCSYCLSSIDKAVRLRNIDIVKKELQFFLDNKVAQVKFIDRTFNCNHDHAMAIWQYIYDNDNGVTNFHFEISADILREDEIALLNKFRPGLAQLEIGVQTTNPDTLKAIRRVMDVDKLEKIVASINSGHNIHQHLDLIAGLPFEDYESFGKSFDRVYGMQPEQLQLGFLKVLMGSEMQERAQEYGIEFLDSPPYEVLYTKWLSYGEVLHLHRIEEMVEIYYNSGQFTHTLPVLEKIFGSAFAMYEALADYYERNGLFVNSPARAYRYNVLLAFAEEADSSRAELYKELLTFDMYLRENVKSRPDFAKDPALFKDSKRDFYQNEEKMRALLPNYGDYDWKQISKMTHLEPFKYPVWDAKRLIERSVSCETGVMKVNDGEAYCQPDNNKPMEADAIAGYILFDYMTRNPLNYEAGWKVIEEIAK